MFHRFSAKPAKARSQAKASNKNSEHTVKRQRIARACDRCRLLRIKCDEQKPCAKCVSIKAKCIVSYVPPRSKNSESSTHSSARPRSDNGNNPAAPPSRISIGQETRNVHKEDLNRSHVQGFFASGQSNSVLPGCLFPQLPHPAVPSAERSPASNALVKRQRSYYLRLFWDTYHPLLQIMSETEFAELDAMPPPTMSDEYSTRSALADSIIALGIQHSHATGLAGRILGLQSSPEATWPGFEYFCRSRECMRTNTELNLDIIRCHTFLALYLMKGNAFRDAYNLLGITIRKAYVAKIHRLPPSHLSEAEKTARMQVWWMLFSLDLQSSLQLDMPAASQKSLVKCPFPDEDALVRYVSSSHGEGGINSCTYSSRLVNLAVIVTDIISCVSTADLVDDGSHSPAALEHHALNLSSALQNLEVWRNQLPSELLLSRYRNGPNNAEMFDFDRDLALPAWQQRQAVLLELHYHNAYTLIQRPFIRLRAHSNDSRQPHVELHIARALHHAIIIVDTVFTISSKSDVLYGWSEVLQLLWNATLTIVAFVLANSLSSTVPRALDSLTRAQAVFESFSPTCPSAIPAKAIVNSLAVSLQRMTAATDNDPMGWDVFTSLLDEQKSPAGLEANDLMPFSPVNPDFNS
jgi:Fungal specific transcription factor domain/Fungal Zn(2)-Cys(6) binuclear cluster domain